MSVVARDAAGVVWSFVKGSPEAVAARASRVLGPGGEAPLDERARTRLLESAGALGTSGFRVLALAYRHVGSADTSAQAEENLVWVGLVGLHRPAARRRQGGDRGPARRRDPHGHGHGRPERHGDGRRARARDRRARRPLPRLEGARPLRGRTPLGGPPPHRSLRPRDARGQAPDRPRPARRRPGRRDDRRRDQRRAGAPRGRHRDRDRARCSGRGPRILGPRRDERRLRDVAGRRGRGAADLREHPALRPLSTALQPFDDRRHARRDRHRTFRSR